MTRETKVGLVVAASFLSLVGIVVASRLARKAEPTNQEQIAQTVKPESNSKGNPAQVTPEQKKGPEQAGDHGWKPVVVTAAHNDAGASPSKAVEPNQLVLPSVPLAATPPPALPSPNTAPNPTNSGQHTDEKNDEHQKMLEALRLAKAGTTNQTFNDPRKPAEDPLPPLPPNAKPGLFEPPPLPETTADHKKDDTHAATETHDKTASERSLFVGPPAPAGAPTLANPRDAATSNPPQPPTAPPPDSFGHQEPAPVPMIQSLTNQGFAPPQTLPPASEPKVQALEPTSRVGNVDPLAGAIALNTPPAPSSTAPTGFNQPKTTPALAPSVGQTAPGQGGVPVSIPAIKPGPSNLPQVTSLSMINHALLPEDTSFEILSTRFYKTTKYAKALHKYNADLSPILVKDNVKQDNPKLIPGQTVLIPPRELLEDRYGAYIDNRPVAAAPVGIGPPPGANTAAAQPQGVPMIGRTPTPVTPSPDPSKSYRVPEQGQMLIEIAQQQLGDRGRWSEIYRLNPTLRPEYPIPGGTQLRLPTNGTGP